MPIGISLVSEIFLKSMVGASEGLEGVAQHRAIVLIFGEYDDLNHARINHEINLTNILQRYKGKGIKLNTNKMK